MINQLQTVSIKTSLLISSVIAENNIYVWFAFSNKLVCPAATSLFGFCYHTDIHSHE